MESRILGFGIRNTAGGNRDPTNGWNPESKFHDQDWNSVPGIRNPEPKTVLDALTWGDLL